MTTELVLLLAVYVFIFSGLFTSDAGPLVTFKKSAPRLAAKIERNITIGKPFTNKKDGSSLAWKKE